jgi:hypothetical protein
MGKGTEDKTNNSSEYLPARGTTRQMQVLNSAENKGNEMLDCLAK